MTLSEPINLINNGLTNLLDLPFEPELKNKWYALIARLQSLGGVVVAFSDGVDSSCLAVAAHLALAPHMLAVTIRSIVETRTVISDRPGSLIFNT